MQNQPLLQPNSSADGMDETSINVQQIVGCRRVHTMCPLYKHFKPSRFQVDGDLAAVQAWGQKGFWAPACQGSLLGLSENRVSPIPIPIRIAICGLIFRQAHLPPFKWNWSTRRQAGRAARAGLAGACHVMRWQCKHWDFCNLGIYLELRSTRQECWNQTVEGVFTTHAALLHGGSRDSWDFHCSPWDSFLRFFSLVSQLKEFQCRRLGWLHREGGDGDVAQWTDVFTHLCQEFLTRKKPSVCFQVEFQRHV